MTIFERIQEFVEGLTDSIFGEGSADDNTFNDYTREETAEYVDIDEDK
jgi:hypothetical protein